MILNRFLLCVFGAALAGLAAPSLAAAPDRPAKANPDSAERRSAQASHSRRVELPFLIESPSSERETEAPAPQRHSGPHPFRETLLKKAALMPPGSAGDLLDGRLSRQSEFS